MVNLKRLNNIDIGEGIMICWVVLFHALGMAREIEHGSSVENICIVFPYLHFFMPWFFYKSGMFFKKYSKRITLWKKDIQKFIMPFIIWSIVGYCLYILLALQGNYLTLRTATYTVMYNFILKGAVPVNEVLWFLLSLSLVRWIAHELIPNKDDKRYVVKCVSIILVCYLLTYILFRFNHHLQPRWIANILSGLGFYTLGYCFCDIEDNKWVLVTCVILFLCCSFCGFSIVDMWPNKLLTGHYLLWMPTSLCGIILFNNICRYINYSMLLSRIITTIGRFAMPIYLTHAIIIIIGEAIVSAQNSMLTINASYIIVGGCVFGLTIICLIWKHIASKFI